MAPQPLPLVLHARLRQRAKNVLLGAVMLSASAFALAQDSTRARFVGAAGVAFFGLCVVYALYRALRPGCSLVIDVDGFPDNASAVGVGFVPWTNVAQVRVAEVAGQPMVAVTLHDAAAVVRRAPLLKRLILRKNASFDADIFMPQAWLPTSVADVVEVMDAARRDDQRRRAT